ncbi:MAG: carbon storage regulator [Acidithiobacillus sp.]|uniref:carbon storage regulator n=1 Tax=Acidithiobacillus sp. TaxID=1872118 RepID=UPI003D02CF11
MLVLTRRTGQAICIGDDIRIVVTRIEDGQVRIGIESSRDLLILREELRESVREANRAAHTHPEDLERWLRDHPLLGAMDSAAESNQESSPSEIKT